MIGSILLLLLFILVTTSFIFFVFCFFIPALMSSYSGMLGVLLPQKEGKIEPKKYADVVHDRTKRAVIVQPESESENRLHFHGVQNCAIFHAAYDSHAGGRQTCIGYGDCIRACPQQAIFRDGKTLVVSDLCSGCGKCVGACPVSLITLAPVTEADEKIPRKYFKFWYACYRMLVGRGRG